MNSYTAQITGLSELAEPLEIGKNYEIKVTADCNSITKSNNEDGSFTFKHKLKQIKADITGDNGQVVKTKQRKSQSALLHAQICLLAEKEGKDGEAEYEKKMILLRHYWPEVDKFLEQLENNSFPSSGI